MTVHVVFETHSLSVDNERGTATGWLDGTLGVAWAGVQECHPRRPTR
jgi:hypothetical protein